MLKPALETSPLDWRNRARLKLKEAEERRAGQTRGRHFTHQENIAVIRTIRERNDAAAAAYFRNSDFDSLSDEELQAIRDELEFLQAEDGDRPTEHEQMSYANRAAETVLDSFDLRARYMTFTTFLIIRFIYEALQLDEVHAVDLSAQEHRDSIAF